MAHPWSDEWEDLYFQLKNRAAAVLCQDIENQFQFRSRDQAVQGMRAHQ
jgi:hypothetical protein